MTSTTVSKTELLELQASVMSEETLQNRVLADAQRLHWRRAHFRPAETKKGWRTPVQGDGKGFPDLLLLRGNRGLAVELKSTGGRLSDEQRVWLDSFAAVGFQTFVWRPIDLLSGRIETVLT